MRILVAGDEASGQRPSAMTGERMKQVMGNRRQQEDDQQREEAQRQNVDAPGQAGATETTRLARCVALTQRRRGHGVSVGAYYLARVLVLQGLRTLIADVTGRPSRAQALLARDPVKNLGVWSPGAPAAPRLSLLLAQARQQTQGRVDVILLDADAALLERAGGLAAGLDYALIFVEPGDSGQSEADRIATLLGDPAPPDGRVGAVYSRVDQATIGELPERTSGRGVPTLGSYPADYLLAAGDDYSLKSADASWPHDNYLSALLRLGRRLQRAVPLEHLGAEAHAEATDGADQPT